MHAQVASPVHEGQGMEGAELEKTALLKAKLLCGTGTETPRHLGFLPNSNTGSLQETRPPCPSSPPLMSHL